MTRNDRSLCRIGVALALFACVGTARPAAAATYFWRPVVPNGLWTSAGNWSPARTSPQPSDVLVFDSGTTTTASSTPSQFVAQLRVINGTNLTIAPVMGGTGLVITGDGTAAPDFEVAAGASLTLTGSNAVSLDLGASATGAVAGTVTFTGGAHRLLPASALALSFTSGSTFIAGGGFTGQAFGLGSGGTPGSVADAVEFQSGARYILKAGGDPFASAFSATSPVVFRSGSTYRLDAVIDPALPNRTIGNFEFNVPGSDSVQCGNASIENIVVDQGALRLRFSPAFSIKGDVTAVFGRFALESAFGTSTCRLDGASRQHLIGSPSWLTIPASVRLVIDNPAGVDAPSGLVLPGPLQFVHGRIAVTDPGARLQLNSLTQLTGASAASGWVAGELAATVANNDTLFRFEIGDTAVYAPLDLTFHGAVGPVLVRASVTGADHPNVATAQLDPARLAHRYWSVLTSYPGGTPWGPYQSFDAVVHFAAADLTPGADPNAFVVRETGVHGTSAWTDPATGVRTATSTEALGVPITDFGGTARLEFQPGQPITPTMSVASVAQPEGGAGFAPRVARMRRAGAADVMTFDVTLSQAAIHPIAVDYATTDLTANSGGPNPAYVPVAGTLTFAPGVTSRSFDVPVIDDTLSQPAKTFRVHLGGATGDVVVTDSVATGTILNDDDQFPPVVAVTAPNGGEAALVGAVDSLRWEASDDVGVTAIDLELSRDGGTTWEGLAAGVPNTGAFGWIVTGPLTSNARLRVTAHDAKGHATADASDAPWRITDGVTAIAPGPPAATRLHDVSPNPAHGRATIRFSLARAGHVRLRVLDVQGRAVATLLDDERPAGTHALEWDAGASAAARRAGVCFVRFEAGGVRETKRVTIGR